MEKVGIGKGFFHQRLAVVKFPVNCDHLHIFTQGGHLFPLPVGYFCFREKDQHFDIVEAVKGIGDGAARIAGGGGQDQQAPVFQRQVILHQQSHHAGGKVFERGRRPLVEPQDIFSIINMFQGHCIVIRILRNFHQFSLRDFTLEKQPAHFKCNFVIGLIDK